MVRFCNIFYLCWTWGIISSESKKKFDFTVQFKNTERYKTRKIGIKKAISNSKSYSSKRKKIWQYIWRALWYHCLLYCRYNIYCTRRHKFGCFWSSMLTKKKSKPNIAKSCEMEKFFKVLIIFLQGCCQPRDKWFEGLLNFNHFRKLDTAWIVAIEQMDLVQSFVHKLSIAQRIHQLMQTFSGLTRYPKKSKHHINKKRLETNFLHDADKLFDIFCYDNKQRKPYGSIMAWE